MPSNKFSTYIIAFLIMGTSLFAAKTTTEQAKEKNHLTDKPKLIFFINPNGRPCQMQDEIITEKIEELSKTVELIYYSTTEEKDMKYFYSYGIRSLPSLIVVDKNGKELKRFSPGIHRYELLSSGIKEALSKQTGK